MALPAAAQARDVKISTDLRLSVSDAAGADTRWIKTPDGRPVVKVLIAVNSSDASLRSLRASQLAHGGSVHCV